MATASQGGGRGKELTSRCSTLASLAARAEAVLLRSARQSCRAAVRLAASSSARRRASFSALSSATVACAHSQCCATISPCRTMFLSDTQRQHSLYNVIQQLALGPNAWQSKASAGKLYSDVFGKHTSRLFTFASLAARAAAVSFRIAVRSAAFCSAAAWRASHSGAAPCNTSRLIDSPRSQACSLGAVFQSFMPHHPHSWVVKLTKKEAPTAHADNKARTAS